ncbi:phosphomannomutase [Natronospira bacteriovora]|uniref:phosphomannomutase n=1 Tax=Natronospira bacteriovora TaxID=3069753 RepID=A0ABU0W8A4_9GAMM|nr:phosphomannomutase [Natronospira sp. AB-CW4]MDQ2070154.1 phosphomannomutase [Natronospira sp. AB-CW4]
MNFFKAYDIRGRTTDELTPAVARLIGEAFAVELAPKTVVVGYDIRLSSPGLAQALSEGLTSRGVDVLNIGLCGTEEVYFATSHLEADGGIMVTASHNPADYNGMKLVRAESRPISGDTGLFAIRDRVAEENTGNPAEQPGEIRSVDTRQAYVEHLLSYIEPANLKPLRIVVNPGNSAAGKVIDELEKQLPFRFEKIHYEPDGHFPNGIPNPLLPENREATAEAVQRTGADMGIAWDGDFDRCFFFDEKGSFIEGYYIVGLLAKSLLEKWPGEKIIHDPRLTWATVATVEKAGGTPIQSKTGHAFIKERMRQENALYGGEMSAHHYFRDFAYCDSGMIPWLLVAELVCKTGKSLGELVAEAIAAYPASGEINRKVDDADACLARIKDTYLSQGGEADYTDGLSVAFEDWRFNLRKSNTEPLLRLNVESRGDQALMQARTREILDLIDQA